MKIPFIKENSLEILDKKIQIFEKESVDKHSMAGLYVSQILLYTGLSLILLNNLGVILPDSYFGENNWMTITIFSIGIIINFASIPWLYFSSFKDFKRENEFWDREIFWILPLFFFGTFFLYCSHIDTSLFLFIVSILVIAAVHFIYIYEAMKLIEINSQKNLLRSYHQYAITLKYLTAYYVLLLALLIFYNPLQQVFNLIRNYA